MELLGRTLDISTAWAPVDLNTANAATGARCSFRHGTAALFVAHVGITGGGAVDTIFTVQQHTAATSGTTASLVSTTVATSTGITRYWVKQGVSTVLDGSEQWTLVTQTEAATVTLAGATYVPLEYMVAIPVNVTQLGSGYSFFSVNVAAAALAHAKVISGDYIIGDLLAKRSPTLMPALTA